MPDQRAYIRRVTGEYRPSFRWILLGGLICGVGNSRQRRQLHRAECGRRVIGVSQQGRFDQGRVRDSVCGGPFPQLFTEDNELWAGTLRLGEYSQHFQPRSPTAQLFQLDRRQPVGEARRVEELPRLVQVAHRQALVNS